MSAARKLAQKARTADTNAARVSWPSPTWRGRHLEFARDVLGKRTIAKHQAEILDEYYINESPQLWALRRLNAPVRTEIVVCTGQKLGKTEVLEIVMAMDWAIEFELNFYLFGPTIDWIDEAIWPRFVPDILAAYYPCAECMPAHRAWCALVETDPYDKTPRPERCPKCSPLIPSELKDPKDPSKGRKSDWLDEKTCEGGLRDWSKKRHLRGYTSIKEGGKGGFSGTVRFAFDESSDVSDITRETVRGNMAGGGKFIAFGNLLYLHGWFYRAFKTEQHTYSCVIQMSSRLSPNCPGTTKWSDGTITANDNAGRPIPGMATREDIEALLVAWKNAKNYIDARIDAKAPSIVVGQLSSMEVVAAAEKRWTPDLDNEGVLQIGVDVARMRDKLAIAVRRGKKIIEIFAEVLGQDDHVRGVELTLEYCEKYRKPHERKPRLVFDASGLEGDAFAKELARQNAGDKVDLYPIQMTFKPRNVMLYLHKRDEIAYHFAAWLKTGAIPTIRTLEAQIEATTAKAVDFVWKGNKRQLQQVITNDELRKPSMLGHSPDELDSARLSAWDVDGSEPLTQPIRDAETSPGTPQAKRATPANDTQDDFGSMDMSDRIDAFTRMSWGRA